MQRAGQNAEYEILVITCPDGPHYHVVVLCNGEEVEHSRGLPYDKACRYADDIQEFIAAIGLIQMEKPACFVVATNTKH